MGEAAFRMVPWMPGFRVMSTLLSMRPEGLNTPALEDEGRERFRQFELWLKLEVLGFLVFSIQ